MKKPPLQIRDATKSIPEALSIYINQLVYELKRKGNDITVLSLGEAFFMIPMFSFQEIDFEKGYHYSDSQGIPELRERIAEFYEQEYSAKVSAKDEILITAGSKPVIYFAMLAVLNPGDEVMIHEPGWLSYQEQIRLVGAKPVFIPYNVTVDNFKDYITDRTKMLIINNPNNPAGRVYKESELISIYEQCRPKGIYIMVDEAYSDFVIDEKFHSMASVVPDKDGVIVVNSLSKNMGMSGWRVGYTISTPTVVKQVLKLNQHIITCAPTILQYYMAKYFFDVTKITLPQVRETVEKRKRIGLFMEELGLNKISGGATFYFMVSIEDFPGTGLDLALYLLLQHQIAVVPGSAYGKSTARYVRIGIGTESEERIREALHVFKNTIGMKNLDKQQLYKTLKNQGLHKFDEAGSSQ